MDIDPRTNVVVFQLRRGRGRQLVGRVPTLAEDGVRLAWENVGLEHKAQARHVVALHSEWEPTPADAAFIAATFPGATVTHHFLRPDADGWDGALAAAGIVLRAELRPVLWSASSPLAGQLVDLPHWPVAAGRLHLALAVVTPSSMYHVTHEQLGDQSFDALMAATCLGLTSELSVDSQEDGLWTVHGRALAAVACLPDFYRRFAELTGAKHLVVGLPSADDIHVAVAGSPAAAVIEQTVLESESPDGELVPCVLAVEGDRVEVLVERERA